jgi:hypothetical protein
MNNLHASFELYNVNKTKNKIKKETKKARGKLGRIRERRLKKYIY